MNLLNLWKMDTSWIEDKVEIVQIWCGWLHCTCWTEAIITLLSSCPLFIPFHSTSIPPLVLPPCLIYLCLTPHLLPPLSSLKQRPELGAGGSPAELVGEIAQQVREAVRGPAGHLWPFQEHGQVPQRPEQPEHAASHHPIVPRGQEGPHLLTRR